MQFRTLNSENMKNALLTLVSFFYRSQFRLTATQLGTTEIS